MGGAYSYIHVLADEFLLKSVVIKVDFTRDSSTRTRIYEYVPPPPSINALVTVLEPLCFLSMFPCLCTSRNTVAERKFAFQEAKNVSQ